MSWMSKAIGFYNGLKKHSEAEAAWIMNKVAEDRPLFVRMTDAFNGRCTFFAVVFTFFGIILAFLGKLTAEYVGLVTAVQALLVAHSMGQDYHERNSGDQTPTPTAGN